jgi:hypothetical protein
MLSRLNFKSQLAKSAFGICVLLGLSAFVPEIAAAQSCTRANSAQIAGCVEALAPACNRLAPSCAPENVYVTYEDSIREASVRCCDKPSKKGRKACLNRLGSQYNKAFGASRGLPFRPLVANARANIRALQQSDCGAGGYGRIF